MNPVVIFGDSTLDLGKDLYKKFNIQIVPLIVREGENVYHDGVDIEPDELYKMVEKNKKLPQTASEGPGAYINAFEPWINKGYDVVYVGIGSQLSSNQSSVNIAAGEFPEGRVYLIDSENLSSASGLLAMKCCKLRDEGKSAKEIQEEVQKLSPLVIGQFCVETLDYLHKGGRCNGLTMLIGNLLHIHPVLRVVNGKLIVYKKIRGKTSKCIDDQVEMMKEDMPNIDMDNIMITSAGADEEVIKYFYDQVAQIVDPSVIRITRAGCVISSHCGYGTIGLLYIKTK